MPRIPDLAKISLVWSWNSPAGTMAARLAGLGVNFGALAIIARWSGQEGLGLVIAMNGAAFLGGVICSLGIPTLLLRTITGHLLAGELSIAANHYRRGIRLVLVASCIGFVFFAIVAIGQKLGWLPQRFGSFGPLEFLCLGLCSLGMAVQFVAISALRAAKQPALSGLFQFCIPPLLLLIIFAVLHIALREISSVAALLALCGSLVLNAAWVHVIAVRHLGNDRVLPLEPIPWRDVRSLWLLGVLSTASANALLLLAGVLLSPAEIAVIGVPFRICNLPMTVVAALGAYYAPLIREAHLRQDQGQQNRELVESQWIGALLVLPVFLAAIAAPTFVLGLFKLDDSRAIQLFLLFAFAQVVIAGCGVCEQYLAMIERAGVAVKITAICFFGMVLGVGFALTHFGVLVGGLVWAVFAVARQLGLRAQCRLTSSSFRR